MRQPFLVTVLVTLQTLCLAANSTPPSPPPGKQLSSHAKRVFRAGILGVTTARVEPEELPAVFGGHNVVVFKCWTNKPIAQSFWTFEDKRLSENDPKRHQSITKVNGTTVATLSIIDPTPQDKGHYKCHIRAWDGSNATSNEAVLVNGRCSLRNAIRNCKCLLHVHALMTKLLFQQQRDLLRTPRSLLFAEKPKQFLVLHLTMKAVVVIFSLNFGFEWIQ